MSEANEERDTIVNVNGTAGRLGNAGNSLCLYTTLGAVANIEVVAEFLHSTLYGSWPGLLAQLDPSISYLMLDAIEECDIDLMLEHEDEEVDDEQFS